MFIVSPATVWNRGALEMRQVPRRFFGRVTLVPRRGLPLRLVWRLVFEAQILRYLLSLLPFVLAVLIWQENALAIAQAPLIMVLVIYGAESFLFRVPKEKRAGLIDRAEAERGLDLLRVRAVSILTRIAAGRQMAEGRLHLVVEQSPLARITPLTFVSVQAEAGPEVLRLTRAEERLIRETLFQPPLGERLLLRINLSENEFLRDVALDLRQISAHARLAALRG